MATDRARAFAERPITFKAMPCEAIDYPDDFFDAVVIVNILHHVSVRETMDEVYRVAKPGLGLEMYTHSGAQKIRESSFMAEGIYPRIRSYIYGAQDPYITPDERKLNESELEITIGPLTDRRVSYFSFVSERLFPSSMTKIAQLDLGRVLGDSGRFFAGRCCFQGRRPNRRRPAGTPLWCRRV